jgi:hypothetical protein
VVRSETRLVSTTPGRTTRCALSVVLCGVGLV